MYSNYRASYLTWKSARPGLDPGSYVFSSRISRSSLAVRSTSGSNDGLRGDLAAVRQTSHRLKPGDLKVNMDGQHLRGIASAHDRLVLTGSYVLCRSAVGIDISGCSRLLPLDHSFHSAPQPTIIPLGRCIFGRWLCCGMHVHIPAIS